MDGVNITIVRQARQAACGLRRGQARRDARLATRRAGTTRARLVPRARPDLPADAQHPGGKPAVPPGAPQRTGQDRHPFVIGQPAGSAVGERGQRRRAPGSRGPGGHHRPAYAAAGHDRGGDGPAGGAGAL